MKKNNFFWPSYADLMTSLFFIMLVLYVLTFVVLKNQQRATEEQLKKITEMQAAVKELPEKYFAYDSIYKRFSLTRNIEFEIQDDNIKPYYIEYLVNVGKSIKVLIDTLKLKYKDQDIKYVVLVEGMASKDSYIDNYALSYRRALSLKKLWEDANIYLDPSICELQIAGSGIGGVGRFPDYENERNQRILIQIIPKIGKID